MAQILPKQAQIQQNIHVLNLKHVSSSIDFNEITHVLEDKYVLKYFALQGTKCATSWWIQSIKLET